MTEPATILHLSAAEYSARTLLVPQLSFLAERGLRPRIACPPEGVSFGPALAPFDPVAVDISRSPGPVDLIRSRRELTRVLDELRPAVLHLHSSSAALAARTLPSKVLKRQPMVFTVHGFPFHWEEPALSKGRAMRELERLLSYRTDMLLFQSRDDYDNSVQAGFRGELRYLGNGVQDSWFDLPAPESSPRLRVLFTGRLIRAKGILDLLDAASLVPDVELIVVGGRLTTERDDISAEIDERLARPALQGRVEMVGSVSPAEVREHMASADLFALPTYHPEGVPRSMIEAMAAGRPIIGTRTRGSRELVRPETGWLVEPRDPSGVAAALADAVERGPSGRLTMGRAARDLAWSTYREADVLERLLGAYEELGVKVGARDDR